MHSPGSGPDVRSAKLLRDEYPDEMAAASCTCEPAAVCGAHRLLARYEELYEHLGKINAARRADRARRRAADE